MIQSKPSNKTDQALQYHHIWWMLKWFWVDSSFNVQRTARPLTLMQLCVWDSLSALLYVRAEQLQQELKYHPVQPRKLHCTDSHYYICFNVLPWHFSFYLKPAHLAALCAFFSFFFIFGKPIQHRLMTSKNKYTTQKFCKDGLISHSLCCTSPRWCTQGRVSLQFSRCRSAASRFRSHRLLHCNINLRIKVKQIH